MFIVNLKLIFVFNYILIFDQTFVMLGYHALKDKDSPDETYEEILTRCVKDNKVQSMQIFVAGPRSSNLIRMNHVNIKKTIKKLGISLYAHNTHLGHPWSGSEHTRTLIQNQLKVCAVAGISGLVIHLPKQPLEVVMNILPTLIEPDADGPIILLEIPSVKPDPVKSWETPEQINKLCKAIRKAKFKNVKICIDTCHLFTSGYDVTTLKMANTWLTSLKYPKMIGMIHLNDSEVPLCNGKDIHAPIFEGLIWKDIKPSKSGVRAFIKFAEDFNIPVILERGRGENESISRELELIRKHF
jgi:deoxyribonuclease-4